MIKEGLNGKINLKHLFLVEKGFFFDADYDDIENFQKM